MAGLIGALLAGCAASPEAKRDVVVPDFLGVIVGADLGRWQIQPEGPDGLVNFGSGGPDS